MTIASQRAIAFAQSCYGQILNLDGRIPWSVDDILFQRARENDWVVGGQVSANGSCHLLQCADEWLAVNLPRPSDWEDVPAWLGTDVNEHEWTRIGELLADRPAEELVRLAQELGLAVSVVATSNSLLDEQQLFQQQFIEKPHSFQIGQKQHRQLEGLQVADFSSLWAGPLCGAVLAASGAHVTKYEAKDRPDGARFGNKAFFDRLHAQHQFAEIDFNAAVVSEIVAQSDVVITSARPRAFAALGIDPKIITNSTTCWIAITAYGNFGPWSNRVGFGDDLAAASGLVDDGPTFVGDAIADPLTGLYAAALALNVGTVGGGFLDISMRDVARSAAQQRVPQW